MTDFAAAARLRKAARLAGTAVQLVAHKLDDQLTFDVAELNGITHGFVRNLTDSEWSTLASAAKVKEPSPETRSLVLDILDAAAQPVSAADVFAGLS